MKIIITRSFEKKYKNIIWLIDIKKLSEKIRKIDLILLKYPYLKLKLNIWGISIRGVLLKTKWWNLVYLILCLKKDKNCWYNIRFDLLKEKIFLMETNMIKDLELWLYKEI